jgi:methylmalonyl-CoA mutase C-terminal domain/subunit
MAIMPRIMALLAENDMTDVAVFIGGIVPNDDIPQLKEMGVLEIFGPGSSTVDIVSTIREAVLGESVR